MQKPIIAIDVDDVLADNAAGFVAFSNKKWGTKLTVDDYEEHWAKVWQLEHDFDELIRRRDDFISSRIHRKYIPIDRAHDVLSELSTNFELHVVTSRLQVMKDDTSEWLASHYPDIFNETRIHYAGIWDTMDEGSAHATKLDIVEKVQAEYLIDDQLKHCIAVAKAGKKALLFGEYSWNQSDSLPDNIIRVSDWSAVKEFFLHEGR